MMLAARRKKELGDETCNQHAQSMETSTSRVSQLHALIKTQFPMFPTPSC